MYVMITCKYQTDQMKNSLDKVATSVFRSTRSANPVVLGRIWPNFKLIQALMYGSITCKYEKGLIKNSCEKVATPFFPL